MTSISDPINNTANASAPTNQRINADFDMFLKLPTSQMRHQDPLDPLDTAEYTSQLAQFSSVEQSIAQGETLKAILARLDNIALQMDLSQQRR